MDRGRGNYHHRGQQFHSSSSSYMSSKDYQAHHKGSSSSQFGSQGHSSKKIYSGNGMKKSKYDQPIDHRKQYDESYERDSQQKYHRSSSSNAFYNGNSNSNQYHNRSSPYEGSTSSSRDHYRDGYPKGGSNRNYDSGSYPPDRRSDGARAHSGGTSSSRGYHKREFSHSFQRGDRRGTRGRGSGRKRSPPPRPQHRGQREERSPSLPSPHRKSPQKEEEDISLDAQSKENPSKATNPIESEEENKKEESKSDKTHLRDEKDGETSNEPTEAMETEAVESATKSLDGDNEKPKEESRKRSVDEREISLSPPRKKREKDFPEHYIRLQCPHCNQRSVTFRDYINHLGSSRHAESLEKLSTQHKLSLSKLRARQRKEQSQMEAQNSRSSHNARKNFCAICKLYHSESRPNHETTELHKIIKNFLMPYCTVCRVNFKSRMLYEKHVATLPHIKNKANLEKIYERRSQQEREKRANNESGETSGEVTLDLDNFTTVDAVGCVDGDGADSLVLEDTPVGRECIQKVEAYFCDICQRYLSRMEPSEKVIELHCRTLVHHRAFEELREGESKANGNPQLETSGEPESSTMEVQPESTEKQDYGEMEGKLSETIRSDEDYEEEEPQDSNGDVDDDDDDDDDSIENCNENEVDSKAGIVNVANFNITTDSGCAKITNEVNNALVSNQEKSFAVPNIKEEPY